MKLAVIDCSSIARHNIILMKNEGFESFMVKYRTNQFFTLL